MRLTKLAVVTELFAAKRCYFCRWILNRLHACAIPTIIILCCMSYISVSFFLLLLLAWMWWPRAYTFLHYRTFDISNNTKFNAKSIFIFYSHQNYRLNIFKLSLSIYQQQQQQNQQQLKNKLFFLFLFFSQNSPFFWLGIVSCFVWTFIMKTENCVIVMYLERNGTAKNPHDHSLDPVFEIHCFFVSSQCVATAKINWKSKFTSTRTRLYCLRFQC